MKISVEAKVAAAVAAGFAALTVGTITQGTGESLANETNSHGPTNKPGVSTHMSRQGYDSSTADRITAETE
jgi:hypothetical protein